MLDECKVLNYRIIKENINIRFNYNQIEYSLIENSNEQQIAFLLKKIRRYQK